MIINGLNIFIPQIGNIDVYLFTSISLIPEFGFPVFYEQFSEKTCQLTPVSPTTAHLDPNMSNSDAVDFSEYHSNGIHVSAF